MGSLHLDTSEARAFARSTDARLVRMASRAAAVIAKSAFDIEADAKALAPVDTGALRSSISSDITSSATGLSAEIGPTVEYGIYQEFGTSTQPGQPYLGPAFDRRLPAFEAAIAAVAAEAIT